MGIQAVEIQGKIDRMNGRYVCGENVQFTFRVLDDNKLPLKSGQLQVVLSNDGGQKMFNQTFDLATNSEIKVSGTLKNPGFLRAVASLKGQKKWNVQGAAFERCRSRRPGLRFPDCSQVENSGSIAGNGSRSRPRLRGTAGAESPKQNRVSGDECP